MVGLPTTGGPVAGVRAPAAVPDLLLPPPLPVPELDPAQWLDAVSEPGPVPGSPGGPPPDHRRGAERAGGRWMVEWGVVLVVALLLAVGVRTWVAQMFYIPSGSMLPTLQIGERIVVDKISFHVDGIHRGEIVVFRRPPLEQADYADLVKRVIGLPGETIGTVDGRVTVDGRPLDEPWLPRPIPETVPSPVDAPFNLSRPYKVPAGEYFVMGDNRTDSEDSRWFGPIPGSLIVGTMAFKAWPVSAATWLGALAVVVVLVVGVGALVLRPARRPGAGRAGSGDGPP